MEDKIISLKQELEQQLSKVSELADIEKVRVAFLGKKGSITALLKCMKDLSHEQRKTLGAEINKLKSFAGEKIDEKVKQLKEKEI